jgi:3-oxoacyl-[acyl-carrier-protein] synthase III
MPDKPAMGSDELWRLEPSSVFRFSYLLRSGALFILTVPPKMFSRATDVTAEALVDRVKDPYQLRARRTCCWLFGPSCGCSLLMADWEDGIRGVDIAGAGSLPDCDVACREC